MSDIFFQLLLREKGKTFDKFKPEDERDAEESRKILT